MKRDSWKKVGMALADEPCWIPGQRDDDGFVVCSLRVKYPADAGRLVRRARALRSRDRKKKEAKP